MSRYGRIDLIRLWPGTSAAVREALLQLPQASASLLQPTLPGVYNGGDLLRRQRGADAAALADLGPVQGLVAHADSAVYAEGEGGGDWSGGGIYRALLLAVNPAADSGVVGRFERELLAMPRYIRPIRAWRLGRVVQAAGARRWTHVWEQRYDELDGLNRDYMMHPCHWAWVDRWFDPEHPDWIVDPHLCHSFCPCA
jgi:hypothetical protein